MHYEDSLPQNISVVFSKRFTASGRAVLTKTDSGSSSYPLLQILNTNYVSTDLMNVIISLFFK